MAVDGQCRPQGCSRGRCCPGSTGRECGEGGAAVRGGRQGLWTPEDHEGGVAARVCRREGGVDVAERGGVRRRLKVPFGREGALFG